MQGQSGQLLADPIMQFLPDAALLIRDNLQNVSLKLLAFGDVVDDAGEHLQMIDFGDRHLDGKRRAVLSATDEFSDRVENPLLARLSDTAGCNHRVPHDTARA